MATTNEFEFSAIFAYVAKTLSDNTICCKGLLGCSLFFLNDLTSTSLVTLHDRVLIYEPNVEACESCQAKVKAATVVEIFNRLGKINYVLEEFFPYLLKVCQGTHVREQSLFSVDHKISVNQFQEVLNLFGDKFKSLQKDFVSSLGNTVSFLKDNLLAIACGTIGLTVAAMLTLDMSSAIVKLIENAARLVFKFILPSKVYDFLFESSPIEELHVNNIITQAGNFSDVARDSPLWRLVIKLLITAFVGCSPLIASNVFTGNMWSKISEIFKNKSLLDAMKEILDYICAYFCIPYSFSRAIPNVVEDLIIEMLNMHNHLRNRDDTFHVLTEAEFVATHRMCDKYEDFVKKFTITKVVSDYLHKFKSHYEFLHAAAVNYKKTVIRMEPVVVTLYGDPGVGKTCSLNTIMGALCGELYGNKYESNLISYTRNPAQDFWDGYTGQPMVLYDDLFQNKDSEANPNPEINDIIRCVNTNSFNLNMADLASKGVTYFVSEWIFATSNVNNLQGVKSIHSVEAVARRLQLNYEMLLNVTFPTPEGDVNCVQYLNRKHREYKLANPMATLSQIDGFMMDVRNALWTFKTFTWSPIERQTFESQTLNFEQMLQACVAMYNIKKDLTTTNKPHVPRGIRRIQEQSGIFSQVWQKTVDIYKCDSFSNLYRAGGRCNKTYLHEMLLNTLPNLSFGREVHDNVSLYDIYLTAIMRNVTHVNGRMLVTMQNKADMDFPELLLGDIMHPGQCFNLPLNLLMSRDMDSPHYREFLRRIAVHLDMHKLEHISTGDFYSILCEVTDQKIWTELQDVQKKYMPLVTFVKVALGVVLVVGSLKLYAKALTWSCTKGAVYGNKMGLAVNRLITRREVSSSISTHMQEQGSNISGENLIKFMISKMKRNMLRFCVRISPTEEVEMGYAVIPKTGVMIFPAHFVRNFLQKAKEYTDAKVVFYRLPSDPTQEELEYPYYISALEMCKLKPYVRTNGDMSAATDLVVYNCTTMEHNDITEFFIAPSEVVDGTIPLFRNATSAHLLVKPDKEQPLLRLSSVGRAGDYFTSIPNYTNGYVPGKLLHNYVTYNLSTVSGDCGGLVLFTTPKGYKFGGLHCAYDTQQKMAFCAMVFQSDFKNLAQTVFQPSDALIEQGYCVRETTIAPYFTSNLQKYDVPPPYKEPMLYSPSRMSVFVNSEGHKVSPMRRATERYRQPHATYAIEDHPVFLLDVQARMSHIASSHPSFDRVWSFEEAVLGSPGISFMEATNRSTSAGYKYTKISPNGKYGFFGDEQEFDLSRPQCAILKRDVYTIIAAAQKGTRLEHIFRDCLKDELLKPSKVEAGDTRLFNTGPLDLQLATKMYFGAFCKMLHDNRLELGISIGINPHTEWKFLYERLTCRFGRAFAGDFSGYDYTTTPRFFEYCLDVVNKWYEIRDPNFGICDNQIRRILHAEVYNSLHIGIDGTYYWLGNNSSGHACTADNNSLYNLLLFAYCARELTGKSIYDIADFCIYGDDNIFVTDEDNFNLESCSVALSRFGLRYGSDEKNGVLYKWKPLSQCSFLKRTFRVDDSRVYAPLEITSIIKTMYYYRKGETANDYLLKCYTRLLELSQHQYDVFLYYGRYIIDKLRQGGFAIMEPTILLESRDLYFHLQEKCRGGEFSITNPI